MMATQTHQMQRSSAGSVHEGDGDEGHGHHDGAHSYGRVLSLGRLDTGTREEVRRVVEDGGDAGQLDGTIIKAGFMLGGGGSAWHSGSIHAPLPVGPGSIPSIPKVENNSWDLMTAALFGLWTVPRLRSHATSSHPVLVWAVMHKRLDLSRGSPGQVRGH